MIQFAVLDDKKTYVSQIEEYIRRYAAEHDLEFGLKGFNDGYEFIKHYKGDYDVVFLDIEMPGLDGMNVAGILREADEDLAIVFITHLAQMAIEGYNVNAQAFLVKPITYTRFASVMNKIIKRVQAKKESKAKYILVNTKNGVKRLSISEIYYIESNKHYLYFHTNGGQYSMQGKLSDYQASLAQYNFCASAKSYLVNLKYVKEICANEVVVEGGVAALTRSHKKTFKDAFTKFINSGEI